MKITVNGMVREVQKNYTIEQLALDLKLKDVPFAVELNKKVITRTQHGTTVLKEGDVVEIVTFVGGG